MQRVAEVAIAAAVGANGLYHYAVPDEIVAEIRPGALVHVPFGPRELQGVVFDPDAMPERGLRLKPIRAVINTQPVVTEAGIRLARWVSAHYACPVSEVLTAMLPPGLARGTVYGVARTNLSSSESGARRLTGAQQALLALIPPGVTVALDDLVRQGGRGAAQTIASLVRRGILVREASLAPGAGPKTTRVVTWTGREPNGRVGPKGRAVLSLLRQTGETMLVTELGRHVDGAAQALGTLQRQGLVRVDEEIVRRDPIAHRAPMPTTALPLTAEQAHAVRAITEALHAGAPAVFLLHGVTGSGKTEVYLQALAEAIRCNRQGMILVPEISLTPQTMDRFAARFPGRIALLHSSLSEGERLDEWSRARDGTVDAVVGARSAVFSPLPNPGLIVLDEEHDASYKQDRVPRYHARDVALRLAQETGAVVILGSATPDVASYYHALNGRYRLLEMTHRAVSSPVQVSDAHDGPAGPSIGKDVTAPRPVQTSRDRGDSLQSPHRVATAARATHAYAGLPPVEIVDLRQELHAGNRSIFSRSLQSAMRDALARDEQVILFLNRRGSATFVICRDCGFVVRCPYCDLPYTYHATTQELICHRCDDRLAPPSLCKRCGSWRIRYFGLGTQKVEEEARQQFPGARLLRWDRDVLSGRHGHEHILDRFAQGHADVLVGTQMVAKGLDIPRVTVVGVISADTALNLPDFRSAERTFQLLTQVAGRAGRHALPGHVVVQTYAPDHFAIRAAAEHDYASFYEQEVRFRAEAGYPPFTNLLRLVYGHVSERACRAAAETLATRLREGVAQVRHGEVIGPAPSFTGKVAGRYLWQILVRADDVHPLLPMVPPDWTRDVDPVSLL